MPAYVIAYLEVTDRERFDEYQKLALTTFAPYGGKAIAVNGRFDVLEGMVAPKSVVVVEFPSYEDARRWYAGEYAATIPMRQRSASTSLIVVDGLPVSAGR